jgi:hypothetical protein
MKMLTSLFFAGALVAGAATFNGVITDTMCGKSHAMMGVKPDSKCVLDCVKQGSKFALYDGKEVYILSDQQTPAKFAAQKVTVTGTLNGQTKIIKVDSITAAH